MNSNYWISQNKLEMFRSCTGNRIFHLDSPIIFNGYVYSHYITVTAVKDTKRTLPAQYFSVSYYDNCLVTDMSWWKNENIERVYRKFYAFIKPERIWYEVIPVEHTEDFKNRMRHERANPCTTTGSSILFILLAIDRLISKRTSHC